MKRIKFDDIKVGDYLKIVSKNKGGVIANNWVSSYFKVDSKELEGKDELWSCLWIDFDSKGRFINLIKTNYDEHGMCVVRGDGRFYKLTEKEYHEKFAKLIIVESLK